MNAYVTAAPERRKGISDLERATEVLEHAIEYLMTEQLETHRSPAQTNCEAITLLCKAVVQIGRLEHRQPARRSITAWLRSMEILLGDSTIAEDDADETAPDVRREELT